MAYQRPATQAQKPTTQPAARAPAPAPKPQAPAPQPAPQQAASPTPADRGSNKPAYRLAVMELNPETGKRVTTKDPETGKTQYAGAAWPNKFGGFNIKLERDLQVSGDIELRLYPVDDDAKFGRS